MTIQEMKSLHRECAKDISEGVCGGCAAYAFQNDGKEAPHA